MFTVWSRQISFSRFQKPIDLIKIRRYSREPTFESGFGPSPEGLPQMDCLSYQYCIESSCTPCWGILGKQFVHILCCRSSGSKGRRELRVSSPHLERPRALSPAFLTCWSRSPSHLCAKSKSCTKVRFVHLGCGQKHVHRRVEG